MGAFYPYRFYPPYRFSPFYRRNSYNSNTKINENLNKSPSDKSEKTSDTNEKKRNSNRYADNPIFELFGIQLYFDDFLLISLIYFLYSEEVQDQFLFIILILLLLS